jgi:hypothetical protein
MPLEWDPVLPEEVINLFSHLNLSLRSEYVNMLAVVSCPAKAVDP